MNSPVQPFRALAMSAGITYVAAEPLRRLLLRFGRLDIPNSRSSHIAPVPRGGGIATIAGAWMGARLSHCKPSKTQALTVLTLSGLGLLDDISGHVPPSLRLLGQLAVGATASEHGLNNRIVGALVTAGFVNAVNFMDGINGISALTGTVWGINSMFVGEPGERTVASLGAITSGAAIGFSPHNMHTGRLFLGDVGSYALGAAIATGVLSQRTWTQRVRVAAPLALYAADTTQAILRRARKGQALSEAHRDHVYQQFVDTGRIGHTQMALIHASLACMSALFARLPPKIAPYPVLALAILYANSPRLLINSSSPSLARPHTGGH